MKKIIAINIVILAILGFYAIAYAASLNSSQLSTTTPIPGYALTTNGYNSIWAAISGSLSGGINGTLTAWTSGTTVTSTSSPTVGYITATSTATSTFAGAVKTQQVIDYTNVKYYGAKGDGVTDDYAAFNLATSSILNASTGNNNVLYIPRGVYKISDTLHFIYPVKIICEGNGPSETTELDPTASFPAGHPLIEIDNGYSSVQNCYTDMNYKGGDWLEFVGDGAASNVISGNRVAHVASGYWGIHFSDNGGMNGAALNNIFQNVFHTFNGGGIWADGGGDSNNIYANLIQLDNSTSDMIKWDGVSGAANLNIYNNNLTGGAKSIQISYASEFKFTGNQVESLVAVTNPSHSMIEVTGGGTTGCNISDNNLNAHYIASSSIYFDQVTNCIVSNNSMYNATTSIQTTANTNNITYIPSATTNGEVLNDTKGAVTLQLNSSGTSFTSNNFAVGTNNPSSYSKFQVNGPANAQGQVYITDTADTTGVFGQGVETSAGNIITGSSKGDADLWTSGNMNLSANGGGAVQMRLQSNGNVGIGTTSPGSLLSIGNTGGINFNPTATSTFGSSANGINLNNGCYAVNGTCVTGGGGSFSLPVSVPAITWPVVIQDSNSHTLLQYSTSTAQLGSGNGPVLKLTNSTGTSVPWLRDSGGVAQIWGSYAASNINDSDGSRNFEPMIGDRSCYYIQDGDLTCIGYGSGGSVSNVPQVSTAVGYNAAHDAYSMTEDTYIGGSSGMGIMKSAGNVNVGAYWGFYGRAPYQSENTILGSANGVAYITTDFNAAMASGGSVDPGLHIYYLACKVSGTEIPCAQHYYEPLIVGGTQTVNFTNLPVYTGPLTGYTGRVLYRTKVLPQDSISNTPSGAPMYIVANLDTSTTTYSDTAADSGLTVRSTTDADHSICIGTHCNYYLPNTAVIGSSAFAPIYDLYLGCATYGPTSSGCSKFTIHSTGAQGADTAGADLALSPGQGTGLASGGNLLFQTTPAGGSSSSTYLTTPNTQMIITPAGRVGIGTTTPLSTTILQVNGASNATGQLYISDSGDTTGILGAGVESTNGNIITGSTKGDAALWTTSNLNFSANSGGTLQMTLKNNGNVGIWTTTPGWPLSVNGVIAGASFVGTTTATSTLGGGLSISRGCFQDAGGCFTHAGGGTVTSVSGTGEISSTGGVGPVISYTGISTNTPPVAAGVFYAVDSIRKVATAATGTLSATGPITVTAGTSVIGGAATVACTTASSGVAGCLGSTAFDTFNNKQNAFSGMSPNTMAYWSSSSALSGTTSPSVGYITATTTAATSTFAGGVGIGSSTPAQTLGVTGGGYFSGNVYASNFYDLSTSGSNCIGESAGLLGTSNCVASVNSSGSTISVSPTSGAVNVDLNLGHSNLWTASTTFQAQTNLAGASTTNLSATNLCIGTICNTSWPSGTLSGGSVNDLTYWTSGTVVSATGSPTVGYITATSTTASQLPYASSTMVTVGQGSALDPSYGFAGQTSGFYTDVNGAIYIGVGGSNIVSIDNTNLSTADNITTATNHSFLISNTGGSALSPTYSFSGNNTTGLFLEATNELSLSINNAVSFRSSSASTTFPLGNVGIGTSSPGWLLGVNGTVGAGSFVATSTSATSTFQGGLNITGSSYLATTSIAGNFAATFASTTGAASETVNWSAGATQRFILDQNTNFVINSTSSNPLDGGKYILKICQPSGGGDTVTFTAYQALRWALGTTTVSTTGNTCTWIGMVYDARATTYSVLASTTVATQ
jgi:fibronectin-binding autotransporter adhesin